MIQKKNKIVFLQYISKTLKSSVLKYYKLYLINTAYIIGKIVYSIPTIPYEKYK